MVDEKPIEPNPQNPAPQQTTPPPAPKKKSWLKRLVIIAGSVVVLLIVVVLFVVPPIGASIAVGKIKEQFRKQMNGEIEIGSLSLSLLGGSAHLKDVRIIPTGEETLFTLPEADATVDVFGALGGRYDVSLVAKNAVVNVVRDEDGTTNLDALRKLQEKPKAETPEKPSEPKKEEEPLDLKARVEITGTRLVFRDKKTGKESEIRNVNIKADVPSLTKDADVQMTFDVANGGQGQVNAKINPDTLSGTADYTITIDTLKSLEAAVGMFAPIEKLEGKIVAKADYTFDKLPEAKGSQTLTIEGLRVVMTGKEPIDVPAATLTQTVDINDKGTGTILVDLKSGQAANLQVNANVTEFSSFVGKLTFTSNLKELTHQMASLLKLKQGYRLEGSLNARSDFNVALKDNQLQTAKIDLSANGTELVVIDSAGARRPMNTELIANLKADYDKPAGTIEIPTLVLTFGDLRVNGKVSAAGLQGTPTLKDSKFDIHADLAKLMDKVGSFMELKQSATGTLDVSAVVADTAPKVSAVTLTGEFKGLKVTGLTRANEQGKEEQVDVGPLNGTLSGRIALDLNEKATSKIEAFKLQTNMASVSASGTFQADTMKMNLATATRVVPDELYAAAGQLIGRKITGKPIDVWVNVQGSPEDMTTSVRVDAPEVEIVQEQTMKFVGIKQEFNLTRKREAVTWTLVGNGIDGRGNGKVLTEPKLNVTMAYELALKTPELSRLLLPAFGLKDVEVDGDVVNIKGSIEIGPATRIRGAVNTKSITAKGGVIPTPVAQKNLELKFDIAQEESKLTITEASFKSDTAAADFKGTLVTQEPVDINMTMSFKSDLERISKDLGGLLKLKPDLVLKGNLVSTGEIKSDKGIMTLTDLTTIKNFQMSGPGMEPVSDAEVKFDADATMDAKQKTIDFKRGDLRSSFIYGTFRGQVLRYGEANQELKDMAVDLAYVPDRLNTVLSPWLAPAKLVGKEERKITGNLNGKATKEGLLSLLQGSNGDFKLNLGLFIAEGFRMDATLKTTVQKGIVNIDGPIQVNGGMMQVKSDTNLNEPVQTPISFFTFNAKDVNLNAENENILGSVNPTMKKSGRIDGQLNADFKGSMPATFQDKDELLQKMKMEGSVNIEKFIMTGSSFIQQLLEWFDVEDRNVTGFVRIPKMTIENGIVNYPMMEMKIQNTLLKIWGTVSLIGKKEVNLTMEAPIDERTLKRLGMGSKERSLIGKTVKIPITGTTDNMQFDFGAPIRKFAEDYIKREIQKGIEDIFKPKKK